MTPSPCFGDVSGGDHWVLFPLTMAMCKLFYFSCFIGSSVVQTFELKHSQRAVDSVTTALPAHLLWHHLAIFVYKEVLDTVQ